MEVRAVPWYYEERHQLAHLVKLLPILNISNVLLDLGKESARENLGCLDVLARLLPYFVNILQGLYFFGNLLAFRTYFND